MPALSLELLSPTPPVAGRRVRLESLAPDKLEPYGRMLDDPELRPLTGTHRRFEREELAAWLSTRATAAGRADWAVIATDDERFVGEVVLSDIDTDNRSGGFRIALRSEDHGRGYGTEATRLVIQFAFDVLGLHRLALEVFAFNARAIATYRRCGFVQEGTLRDALRWDDRWHDTIVMAVLATDERPRR